MFADRIVSHLKGENGAERYNSYTKLKIRLTLLFASIAAIMAFLSIGIGKYDVNLIEGLEIIYDYIVHGPSDTIAERVVFTPRIPRGLMAVIVGAGLAIAGAVMQSMLHNPLADPYTTGVSSGASMGASLFVVLGISIIPISGSVGLMSNAFLFALIPAFLIMAMSFYKRITSTTMILIGLGVMYMFSALTQMLKVIATPQQMERLYLWQMGSLGECSLGDVVIVAAVVFLCGCILYSYRVDLNLLSVGDKPAVTMGTDPWRTRIICLIVVSFMTAVAVSFTGVIGFVGLVAPQMVRVLIGSDNRFLLPASAAFGGMFLVICDCLCRVLGPTGVPVGVLTAVIGSPLFLYMLIKRSKKPTVRTGKSPGGLDPPDRFSLAPFTITGSRRAGSGSFLVHVIVLDHDHGIGSGVEVLHERIEDFHELPVQVVSEIGTEDVGIEDLRNVGGPGYVGYVLVDDHVVIRVRLHQREVLAVILEFLMKLFFGGLPDGIHSGELDYVFCLVLVSGCPLRIVFDPPGVIREVGEVLSSCGYGVLRKVVFRSAHAVRVHGDRGLLLADLRGILLDDLVVLIVETHDLGSLAHMSCQESYQEVGLGGFVAVIGVDPDAGDSRDGFEDLLDVIVCAGVQSENGVNRRVLGELLDIERVSFGSDGREFVCVFVERGIDGTGLTCQGDSLVVGADGIDDGVNGGSGDDQPGNRIMRSLEISAPVEISYLYGFPFDYLLDQGAVRSRDLPIAVSVGEGVFRLVPGLAADEIIEGLEIIVIDIIIVVGIPVYFQAPGGVGLPWGIVSTVDEHEIHCYTSDGYDGDHGYCYQFGGVAIHKP